MSRMRMSHIGLCVSDWKRSMRFYRDLLGFELAYELQVKGEPSDTLLGLEDVDLRAVYLEREGFRLELLDFASPGEAGGRPLWPINRLGLTHLSLAVEDLDALVAELVEAGVEILRETRISTENGSRAIFVRDPDGLPIELVQAASD